MLGQREGEIGRKRESENQRFKKAGKITNHRRTVEKVLQLTLKERMATNYRRAPGTHLQDHKEDIDVYFRKESDLHRKFKRFMGLMGYIRKIHRKSGTFNHIYVPRQRLHWDQLEYNRDGIADL